LEIIHAATQESARAVGLEKVGVIRPGYEADLLVLDMNPLDDFKALYATGTTRVAADGTASTVHGLRYTILDGKVMDPQAMLRDVAGMVRGARR
ncbi:MAG TPA: amidohydrolase family protein, partial [Longimicrobiales bacterium]|nr:amidohydrolase family protein [Longimicrobiales bacterium]